MRMYSVAMLLVAGIELGIAALQVVEHPPGRGAGRDPVGGADFDLGKASGPRRLHWNGCECEEETRSQAALHGTPTCFLPYLRMSPAIPWNSFIGS